MKVLFFVPERYSLFHSFKEIFKVWEAEVYPIDFNATLKKWEIQFNVQVFRLPNKWRVRWETYFMDKINRYYRQVYDRRLPDLVFIYNNEMLLPETLEYFKRKSKIAFFLGDHPLYTSLNRYYLSLLNYADAIFAPDTFWVSQLKKMGLKNVHFFQAGIPSSHYYEKQLSEVSYQKLKSEILYVGMCYTDNWGYKKAKFLNYFSDHDLQIHGNRHWERWFSFFPNLEPHFRLKSQYYNTDYLNDLLNATKIVPVDGNPGLINGVHIRLYEALGSGALPLLEWQNDLDEIFPAHAELPAPKSYDEINEITRFYLQNEADRKEKVAWMKKIITEKYSPKNNAHQMFKALGYE
ncbi:MAG: glycosyltransferase family 1 protein [Saprospiraceae bacterium]|nr:glycosyltransferase family 1 protein [Saprospiraceae bacterium]MCB9322280.1 glycosyltransferase family 1 protein [Lewinellaceae bacterium]